MCLPAVDVAANTRAKPPMLLEYALTTREQLSGTTTNLNLKIGVPMASTLTFLIMMVKMTFKYRVLRWYLRTHLFFKGSHFGCGN